MPITQKLKEVYANPQHDVRYIETIELSHPKFKKVYYFTNDVEHWRFQVEDGSVHVFDPIPFTITLPGANNTGQQELQLGICNVGMEMMEALELANEQPEVNIKMVYRVYLDVDDSAPQNSPPTELTISDVSANITSVTATATRFDVLNRKFPSTRYNVEEIPGLLRG
jgi:hypothetical protein